MTNLADCICEPNYGTEFGAFGYTNCWTPYAQAIADEYYTIVPYYLSVRCPLTAAPQTRISIAQALENDVLLFGANLSGFDDDAEDNGQRVYLNVKDLRSGISWTPGNPLMAAPLTAFAGVGLIAAVATDKPMPIQLLPEAFFLPAHVELQLEWKTYSVTPSLTPAITFVGVQLIRPKRGKAPEVIKLPNGNTIKVGSRIPWLASLGLGDESLTGGGGVTYTFTDNQRFVNYTPPEDCDIEIHDLHANFFTLDAISANPENVMVSFSDTGEREMWAINKAPAPAVLADVEKIPPTMPFSKPYLLKANRRLRIDTLNLSGDDIIDAYITARGVQLCQF